MAGPSASPFERFAVAIAVAIGSLTAQDVEVGGIVTGPDGQLVVRARIDFEPLDLPVTPRRGRRGNYRVAHARTLAQQRLPITVTDRSGTWRVVLTPAQAALTTTGIRRFVMRVRADGFATWQRAIGTDLRALDTAARVQLEHTGPGRSLALTVRRGRAPARGWAVIARPFRFDGNRAVWLRAVLPLDATGTCRYDEPPRVSGESPAVRPTARAEGYRVTVFAADGDATTRTLASGRHTLDIEAAPWGARKVLAARAAPAKGPIRVTYMIAGARRTLEFDAPLVPLVGGELPESISTGSGPVEIDTWDPDVPLFVDERARADADQAPAKALDRSGELRLTVRDPADNPVFGASVWIENAGAATAADDADVSALTDARGAVRMQNLPRGTFHVLVHHAAHGEREGLLTIGAAPSRVLTVRLRAASDERTRAPSKPLGGTLLFDLGDAADPDAACEVGILTEDGTLVRRPFDTTPRLLRVDGLVAGPARGYVIVDRAPVFFGGLLARTMVDDAIALTAAPMRRTELVVADAEGKPVVGATASLGERQVRDGKPRTTELLPLRPGTTAGRYAVDIRSFGAVWIQVHGPDGSVAEVQLGAAEDGEALTVTLGS